MALLSRSSCRTRPLISAIGSLRNLQRAAGLLATIGRSRWITVTDWKSNRPVWRLAPPDSDGYAAMAFSPGERLLAVSAGLAATLFTVGDWRQQARFELPASAVDRINLAWSADGKLFACQDHDHVIKLLDASLANELLRLEIDPGDCVVSRAFCDDDSRLIAGTRDGKLHVWHLGLIRQSLARVGLDWRGHPTKAYLASWS